MSRRVLVAGIGNIFLRDDGFGVEVANALCGRSLPDGVRVADFGIRGVHLAYELLEGYEVLVLIDAVPMHEAPGTLAVIEPESGDDGGGDEGSPIVDAHSMSPDVVLAMLERLGGVLDQVYVVGCAPGELDEGIGLSAPVAAAVGPAVELCVELVTELVEARAEHRSRVLSDVAIAPSVGEETPQ